MSVSPKATRQELLIFTIARLLAGCRHVCVGAASPIPGAGALLARLQAQQASPPQRMFVNVRGSVRYDSITNGGVELFDMAGQGRVDAFFLSGGQIDGEANINLTGTGAYPRSTVRWPGAFGSAYLYFVVPKVILFREEHSRRVLVPHVDFVTAPGPRCDGVYRPGGPVGLLTNLAWFSFDKALRKFRLESLHEGHTIEEVLDNTGFDFTIAECVANTEMPDAGTLALIRGEIAVELRDTYPRFVDRVFPVGTAG